MFCLVYLARTSVKNITNILAGYHHIFIKIYNYHWFKNIQINHACKNKSPHTLFESK